MPSDTHAAFLTRAQRVFAVAQPVVISQRYYAPDREQLRQQLQAAFGHIPDKMQRLAAGIQQLRAMSSNDYAVRSYLTELTALEERLSDGH